MLKTGRGFVYLFAHSRNILQPQLGVASSEGTRWADRPPSTRLPGSRKMRPTHKPRSASSGNDKCCGKNAVEEKAIFLRMTLSL